MPALGWKAFLTAGRTVRWKALARAARAIPLRKGQHRLHRLSAGQGILLQHLESGSWGIEGEWRGIGAVLLEKEVLMSATIGQSFEKSTNRIRVSWIWSVRSPSKLDNLEGSQSHPTLCTLLSQTACSDAVKTFTRIACHAWTLDCFEKRAQSIHISPDCSRYVGIYTRLAAS